MSLIYLCIIYKYRTKWFKSQIKNNATFCETFHFYLVKYLSAYMSMGEAKYRVMSLLLARRVFYYVDFWDKLIRHFKNVENCDVWFFQSTDISMMAKVIRCNINSRYLATNLFETLWSKKKTMFFFINYVHAIIFWWYAINLYLGTCN